MALDGRKSTYLCGVGAILSLASISLAGSPFSSWAPFHVTVHAWPWMAGSPHLRRQVNVIFLTNTLVVRAFFALSHLASRLTPLFGEPATGLHVHQRDASLICSLFRSCRQALFGKGDRQVAFCPHEISKNDHMPERNAALVGLSPSATGIDSTARRFLKLDKLKTSSRLSAICCALATFCNHEFAPTMYR